ncbi:MAG: HIT domain-containing protein [Candidatus Berkiellales bacterium]
MKFVLDPKLEQDSEFIIDLPLCQARLSNNAAFPWIILVPRQDKLVEIIDLNQEDQEQLLREIRQTSHILQRHTKPKKLNIANLGNIVAQLHVHIIARFETDPAWPNPVWNSGFNIPYSTSDKNKLLAQLVNQFKE